MTNIDVINEMQGKPYAANVCEKEMTLKQLDLDELGTYAQLQSDKKPKEMMAYLIRTTLKKSVDGITDEQIKNLSPEFASELVPIILTNNGFIVPKGDEIAKNLSEDSTLKNESS